MGIFAAAANKVRSLVSNDTEPEVPEDEPPQYTYEELGLDPSTVVDFDADALLKSDRRKQLAFQVRYFRCDQHDHKTFDFDGRISGDGPYYARQRVWGTTQAAFFVPFDQRRPSAPYRLGRKVVHDHTDMIFGHGQFPTFRVAGNEQRQDWIDACVKELQLQLHMIKARNRGGACGTVGLSWRFVGGKPRMAVHSGETLHVFTWADRDGFIPEHAAQIYKTKRDVRDPKTGRMKPMWFWVRRDWTPVADVFFYEVEVEGEKPPVWTIDPERTYVHGDGEAHIVWVTNLPDDDESSIDGLPDYAEQYETMDAIDQANSVTFTGAKKNLDPTLVLKMDKEVGSIRKGSDNALTPGASGDAKYLELSGASVDTGLKLVAALRDQVFEGCQVISPAPDKVAAQGTSAVALKMMYRPMLSRSDIYRMIYGAAMCLLLNQIIRSAQNFEQSATTIVQIVKNPDTGEMEEQTQDVDRGVVILPPKVEEVQETVPKTMADLITGEQVPETQPDPITGVPVPTGAMVATGKTIQQLVPVTLGPDTGEIEPVWPDYFKPGPKDLSDQAEAMVKANGGRPIISQQSSTESFAGLAVLDPTTEVERLKQEALEEAQRQAQQTQAMLQPPSLAGQQGIGEPDQYGDAIPPAPMAGKLSKGEIKTAAEEVAGKAPADAKSPFG